jgi:hypothetical protein
MTKTKALLYGIVSVAGLIGFILAQVAKSAPTNQGTTYVVRSPNDHPKSG